MESKVAVFGGADFVMPFSTLGLDTFAVEPDGDEVSEVAKDIVRKRYPSPLIIQTQLRYVMIGPNIMIRLKKWICK